MSMQVGGLVSGLDTWGLVEQLMEVERRPLVQVQERQEKLEGEAELFDKIKARLDRLVGPLEALKEEDAFLGRSAESNNVLVAEAEAGSEAAPGHYHLQVQQLATPTRAESAGGVGQSLHQAGAADKPLAQANLRRPVTGGTFTINNVTLQVNPSRHSLQDVADMINGHYSGGPENGVPGVTAHYVSDPGDENYDRLVLEADPGRAIYLGSSADTSNFLEATGLLAYREEAAAGEGEGNGPVIIAGHRLGGLPADRSLDDVGWSQEGFELSAGGILVIDGTEVQWSQEDTLEEVLAAINASGAGVHASFDPAADLLVLKSADDGNLGLSLQDKEGNLLQAVRILDPEGYYRDGALQLGQNAVFQVNGQTVVRRQNSGIDDVVPGLELNLAGAGEATITVQADSRQAQEAIQALMEEFVATYNLLREYTAEEGDLQGERTVNRLLMDMRRAVTDPVPGAEGPVRSLADLGLSFSREGKPSFNAGALQAALARNPEAVHRVFSGDQGITRRLETVENNYNHRRDGFLSLRQDTLRRLMADQDRRMTDLERRLEMREERYIREFTRMERILSQFESQSQWLNQRLQQLDWGK